MLWQFFCSIFVYLSKKFKTVQNLEILINNFNKNTIIKQYKSYEKL